MPSDHVIPDTLAFAAAVTRGIPAAMEGQLVTFGITPSQPETGYGYLELNSVPNDDHSPQPLKGFVEKPDLETAKSMLVSGQYLWNAGIFLFTANSIIEAFEHCAPEVCIPVRQAFEAAHPELGFLRLDPNCWAKVPDISVDYAVMEHADSLAVVPFAEGWSDLGSWEAVLREMSRDSDGVGLHGSSTAIDCSDTLLRSENPDIRLVGLGLKDMIVVATLDAILVAPTSRAQDVKQVVDKLK